MEKKLKKINNFEAKNINFEEDYRTLIFAGMPFDK